MGRTAAEQRLEKYEQSCAENLTMLTHRFQPSRYGHNRAGEFHRTHRRNIATQPMLRSRFVILGRGERASPLRLAFPLRARQKRVNCDSFVRCRPDSRKRMARQFHPLGLGPLRCVSMTRASQLTIEHHAPTAARAPRGRPLASPAPYWLDRAGYEALPF